MSEAGDATVMAFPGMDSKELAVEKRKDTGGYDPSGIDLEAWTELEEQLDASLPNYD